MGEDDRLREKLRQSFRASFNESKEFEGLQGVNVISDWYKEAKEAKNEEGAYNKRVILSTVANKASDELVKQVEPFYEGTIIKNVGIRTQFKEGGVDSSFNIELISVKPFVKFVKQVDGQEFASVRFVFQLDTTLFVDKLQVRNNSQAKSIKVQKLGIELSLLLLQITISVTLGIPVISVVQPIKLGSRKFEINDLMLYSRQSRFKTGAPLSA
jgi:hypothetical protein